MRRCVSRQAGRPAARPGGRSSRMHSAEIDSADERGAAVDHQQLAVVAVVDEPLLLGRQRVGRIELEHLHAAGRQAIEERLRRADGADAVVEQVDLHALRALLQQQLRELPADLVVLDDVGLEVDVVGGGADRGKHRPVGRRAVLQQEHPVARRERAADDGLLDGDVLLQDVELARIARESVEDGCDALRGKRAARALDLHLRDVARPHVEPRVGQLRATCRERDQCPLS